MKLRSIIWTYVALSFMYFTNTVFDFQTLQTEKISQQEQKNLALDSAYLKMTLAERINLLSVITLSSDSTELKDSLLLNSNGFLFSKGVDFGLYNFNKEVNANSFVSLQLRITETDTTGINNLMIGQTNRSNLAKYAQALNIENIKNQGINIILGNYFQTYDIKLNNENIAFTQSPLSSEKYWDAILEGAEENGLKMGVTDPFMLNLEIDSSSIKDFLAIGLSGNRYYARKGHDIIQMNNNFINYKNRISSENDKNEQSFLRENFRFNGIIISPDFSKVSIDSAYSRAFESIKAGSDLVCINQSSKFKLDSLLTKYFEKREAELKEKCERVLSLKYDLSASASKKTNYKKFENQFEYQTKQAALNCVKNKDKILPISNLNSPIYYLTLSTENGFFKEQLLNYTEVTSIKDNSTGAKGICIVDGFNESLVDAIAWTKKNKGNLKFILVTDQISVLKNRAENLDHFEGVIIAGDDSKLSKEISIQSIFGAYSIEGKLPFYLSPTHPIGAGISLKSIGRLAYVSPKHVGISQTKLDEIDEIIDAGIEAKAFPGCQVLVGFDGKIIYKKSFGHQDYTGNIKIDQQTIYDIASITKIAASTSSLMKLQSDGLFSLDKTLGDYLPELVENTEFEKIKLKDMMAHQAGLPAWIPFYTKTLSGGKPSSYYYSKIKTPEFSVPVAKDLWIRNDYTDTIYNQILSSQLKNRTYLYSDLGYYFVKKIIEKLAKESMENYVCDSIYKQLGLQTMSYNPYLKFDLSRIAPTEDDKGFRKQVLHGYVHDPGAAMIGGVGGHAGVFSTANDLAILMQMMLNGGCYGGKQIIKKEVLDEFTSVQFPNSNKRGAGFDKPNLNGTEGTACAMASPVSYGHSGFTGTLTWADPKYKINYVFLSNRVYPSAENWKIVKMDIRTRIQTKIYEAVQSASNFNFLL